MYPITSKKDQKLCRHVGLDFDQNKVPPLENSKNHMYVKVCIHVLVV